MAQLPNTYIEPVTSWGKVTRGWDASTSVTESNDDHWSAFSYLLDGTEYCEPSSSSFLSLYRREVNQKMAARQVGGAISSSPSNRDFMAKLQGITAAVAMAAITVTAAPTAMAGDGASTTSTLVRFQPLRKERPHAAAFGEMESYRDLLDGWEGAGSVAPSHAAIDNAMAFLKNVRRSFVSPEATVSPDGAVGWFWKDGKKFINIAFYDTGAFAYYAALPGWTPVRGTAEFDSNLVSNDLLDIIAAF